MTDIGTLREGPLHAALKAWVAEPGDRVEVPVGGFVVDVVRDDLLIEVQTGGFSALGPKLDSLLDHHRIRIVAPVATRTRVTKVSGDGEVVSDRWSPKREPTSAVFARLVSFPTLLAHPHLEVQVVGTTQRQVRRHHEGRAWRRRGWVTEERHLLEVVDDVLLASPADALDLLPRDLPPEFGTAEVAAAAGTPRRLAQQTVYCLAAMGVLTEVGRDGNARRYAVTQTAELRNRGT
jgi:hypothetical protein